MKLLKHLLSVLTVFALAVNVVSLDTSASIRISEVPAKRTVNSVQTKYFDNIDSVTEYVRDNMTKRISPIEFSVPSELDGRETVLNILRNATSVETEDSHQGDYLRKSLNYVEYSIGTYDDKIEISLNADYTTTAEQEKLVDEKIAEILRTLDISGKNDYKKISAVYEYIINNVTYDNVSDNDLKYTAYGALYNGTAVCQGIAMLFYRMAREAGISCRIIVGEAGSPHAWNIAEIDGIYYLLDPTFDLYFSKIPDCKYFMLGTEDFDDYNKKITHIPASAEMGLSSLDFDYESESFQKEYPISSKKFAVENKAGDINSDGYTDAVDASMILAEYAELSTNGKSSFTTVQEIIADVNDDDEINAVDASMLLQYYAYISTTPADEHINPEDFFKKEVI